MKSQDFFVAKRDYYNHLASITGHDYLFANGAVQKWNNKIEHGHFYQLMPLQADDGIFGWYVEDHPTNKSLSTKPEAVLQFVKYWIEWKQVNQKR